MINTVEEVDMTNHSDLSLSIDEPDRREVLWSVRIEDLCNKWKNDCLIRTKRHDLKAKIFKRRFAIFALPAIVLPLVMSGLSNVLVEYPLISSSGMAITAILTGINTFYNNAKRELQHFEYSAKFFKLSIDVERELAKKKRDRLAADVFLERVSMDYNNLAFNAPPL
jgi:hypothetical protein